MYMYVCMYMYTHIYNTNMCTCTHVYNTNVTWTLKTYGMRIVLTIQLSDIYNTSDQSVSQCLRNQTFVTTEPNIRYNGTERSL
jgi:hypothetical protein